MNPAPIHPNKRLRGGVKLKITGLLFILVFLPAIAAYCGNAEDATRLFERGNTYYSKGEFVEAISNYEKILASGYESGPLYYNLANAYFKEKSLGKAILNYMRAKRLMPQDADLESNLSYARSRIKGGTIRLERGYFTRLYLRLIDSFSLNSGTLISSVIYFALCVAVVCIILFGRIRRPSIYAASALAVLLAVSLSVFFAQFTRTVADNTAVVTSESLDAKFEPLDQATTFFTLHEGESVTVISLEKEWLKIKRPDGKSGWVEKSDVEFL